MPKTPLRLTYCNDKIDESALKPVATGFFDIHTKKKVENHRLKNRKTPSYRIRTLKSGDINENKTDKGKLSEGAYMYGGFFEILRKVIVFMTYEELKNAPNPKRK